ncbi:hypothetical protein TMatcc_007767 [Talaromyces marneffei ATCC 18224]
MDVFWAAPPISRTLTALAFFEGLAVHGKLIPGFRFVFIPKLIFTFPPEPWRLITPFFIPDGGVHFFFDLYFLYTYASGLERGAPRFALPGDFTVYLIFVCTVIMPSAQCITIQKIENNLSLHFVYIASRCLEQSTIAPHHICPPSFPS